MHTPSRAHLACTNLLKVFSPETCSSRSLPGFALLIATQNHVAHPIVRVMTSGFALRHPGFHSLLFASLCAPKDSLCSSPQSFLRPKVLNPIFALRLKSGSSTSNCFKLGSLKRELFENRFILVLDFNIISFSYCCQDYQRRIPMNLFRGGMHRSLLP